MSETPTKQSPPPSKVAPSPESLAFAAWNNDRESFSIGQMQQRKALRSRWLSRHCDECGFYPVSVGEYTTHAPDCRERFCAGSMTISDGILRGAEEAGITAPVDESGGAA